MLKNTNKKGLLPALLMAVMIPIGVQAQSKVGTTAAPFLGISVGPKAGAMGDAFVAMASDASGLFYNPGAISRTGQTQFLFSHTNWLVNTNFNWIGFVLNLDGQNAVGVSFTSLDYGDEEVTTVTEPEGTGDFWTAGDMSIALSYARNLSDRFSIGGSAKYISQRIWHEKATAFALDVGLLFITDFNNMRLGMSISNFGSDMQMAGNDLQHRIDLDPNVIGHNETIVGNLKTEAWPLPLFFRVGVAMDVLKMDQSRLTVAIDALRPSDNTEVINIGAEFAFQNLFFMRGGYKSLFREENDSGLTFGFGANVPVGGVMQWQLDYTFATYGLFEDVHMISVGLIL